MITLKKIGIASIIAIGMVSCTETGLSPTEWVSSSRNTSWQTEVTTSISETEADSIVEINTTDTLQTIQGFGACFNELGWVSLNTLSQEDRDKVFTELFSSEGMNLTLNRMPIGANDFSLDYYSYNDVDGDFEMKNFSIAHDDSTLIPYIKAALKVNPDMRIWASPWCPPSWMKTNKHYACASTKAWFARAMASTANEDKEEAAKQKEEDPLRFRLEVVDNGLPVEREVITEGTDVFIQEPAYLQAYATYFGKFIDAYKEEGINIFMVMPQNEPNSAQPYPACLWSSKGLANFIKYLGPEMHRRGVKVFLGTIERADPLLPDSVVTDPEAGKYISGLGFQWAGKDALPILRNKYPNMQMFQTEQECGNGLNNWEGAMHSWDLMKHYIVKGKVNAYDYWNISLFKDTYSRWGWYQNSLVTVDKDNKTYMFTPEAYLLKHVSHYVKPGAKCLNTKGNYSDVLAFVNPDNSVAVIVANQNKNDMNVTLNVNGKRHTLTLKAESVNTISFK
ncbi:MAG: glycoside hydrolase family 30 protein [Prevotellaceae bacterium]|nr:glycoside hydrolase family 30 protein [Prevotellaceae bacterium]